jgi:hypothetical protein
VVRSGSNTMAQFFVGIGLTKTWRNRSGRLGHVQRKADAPGMEKVNVGLDRRWRRGEQGASRPSETQQRLAAVESIPWVLL